MLGRLESVDGASQRRSVCAASDGEAAWPMLGQNDKTNHARRPRRSVGSSGLGEKC